MNDSSNCNSYDEKPHEECGVFGIYTKCGGDVALQTYHGLLALQHRGQESCGIAVNDCGVISYHKDMGLVSEVFNRSVLEKLPGQMAVGHVRYSTAGGSVRENAQPLVMRYIKGTLAIAHNGNLINTHELRAELEHRGCIFQTTIDSEVLAYIIARERVNCPSVEAAVQKAMEQLKGSYSLLVMSPRKLIAARDPLGIRPLCIGRLGKDYIFASETCALAAVGADFVREVEPGEIVVVDKEGMRSIKAHCTSKSALCVFEYIYFARSDSVIEGVSVYEAHKEAGRILARQNPVKADVVIGVPESGIDAAMGYAEESGIPYEKGIVKNNYIGRTFIKPLQSQREQSVRIKLNALSDCVRGKRVVMIDDSIVRGTTCGRIVRMLKQAGATEVHLRISSPPFLWPCYYGTDVPAREELAACRYTIEEMARMMDADSLGFLKRESLPLLMKGRTYRGYCDACFSGCYPAGVPKYQVDTNKKLL